MIRIVQHLFPGYSIAEHTNNNYMQSGLISIVIKDQLFFIEILYSILPENFIELLHQKLLSITENSTSVHMVEASLDFTDDSKQEYHLYGNEVCIQINLSLEFCTYMGRALNFTTCSSPKTFFDLKIDLFRFQPSLLPKNIWLSIPHEDLENIFNTMLCHNIASIKMFALFFQLIPLKNPSSFFSKRIAKELEDELKMLLPKENPYLLHSIYYIIEQNLIAELTQNCIHSLAEFHQLIQYYQISFLENSLPKLDLQDIFPQISTNSVLINSLVQKVPYKALVSFLKFSSPSNFDILKSGFSSTGRTLLQEDCSSSFVSISNSMEYIRHIVKIEVTHYAHSLEYLVNQHITTPRDWELMIRYGSLKDVLVSLDTLPKSLLVSMGGITKSLYTFYQNKLLIIPCIQKILRIEAHHRCCENILILKRLHLLSK